MCSRSRHTICYAEFVLRLGFRNWIGTIMYQHHKTNCVSGSWSQRSTSDFLAEIIPRITEMKSIKGLKHLKQESMEGLENHEQYRLIGD